MWLWNKKVSLFHIYTRKWLYNNNKRRIDGITNSLMITEEVPAKWNLYVNEHYAGFWPLILYAIFIGWYAYLDNLLAFQTLFVWKGES